MKSGGAVFELGAGVGQQQIRRTHHALEGRQLAGLDFFLKRAARGAHQPRGPGQAEEQLIIVAGQV